MINRRTVLPVLFIIAGVFLLMGAIILVLFQDNAQSPGTSSAITSTPLTPNSIVSSSISRVSVEDAKKAFDQGTAIFIDVRDPQSFADSHIPSSINIPLADIETSVPDLNHNQWIITVCT